MHATGVSTVITYVHIYTSGIDITTENLNINPSKNPADWNKYRSIKNIFKGPSHIKHNETYHVKICLHPTPITGNIYVEGIFFTRSGSGLFRYSRGRRVARSIPIPTASSPPPPLSKPHPFMPVPSPRPTLYSHLDFSYVPQFGLKPTAELYLNGPRLTDKTRESRGRWIPEAKCSIAPIKEAWVSQVGVGTLKGPPPPPHHPLALAPSSTTYSCNYLLTVPSKHTVPSL